MKQQFFLFVIRWVLNSFGLWIAVRIFGTGYNNAELVSSVWVFLFAGLIFSVINSILRPVVIILSLPAILLTVGLFTIIVNGLMVYLTQTFAGPEYDILELSPYGNRVESGKLYSK